MGEEAKRKVKERKGELEVLCKRKRREKRGKRQGRQGKKWYRVKGREGGVIREKGRMEIKIRNDRIGPKSDKNERDKEENDRKKERSEKARLEARYRKVKILGKRGKGERKKIRANKVEKAPEERKMAREGRG